MKPGLNPSFEPWCPFDCAQDMLSGSE